MKEVPEIINLLRKEFARIYGIDGKETIIRSPGRINLIGEHTDYNNGFVLPSAIDRAIYLGIAPNSGFEANISSLDFNEDLSFDVRNPAKSNKTWANYLLGIVNELNRAHRHLEGFDCVFSGDIPIGAGMSSSAALEVGLAFALNEVFYLNIGRHELARFAQRAENHFVGVKCGIMDQFANLFSKGESVLHLDCRSMEYEYIPFTTRDLTFVLCDTGVKHSLTSSEYNLRRAQCERGVSLLKRYIPQVQSLRDADLVMLDEYKEELGETVYKRCSYVVEENCRVESASRYLRKNDYAGFGQFLYESHQGLKNKFEVTCRELDVLVDTASMIDGVLGARMMGGGFGGCTLNLLEHDSVAEFKRRISDTYLDKTGKRPQLYQCALVSGTGVVPD